MAYETRDLTVKINGDTSDLDKALTGSTSNLSKASASISKFANVAAGALLAVGTAAVGFGVSSVKAFEESQNALAQTDAVIKSTGGSAGVTRDEVLKLATAFEANSRYADETIQSAENMLLTFTNIGKNVFPETTQAVLDMSTAMGQDLQTTAIQVGKALQDPVLGATALQRVGVRLTDTQKKLIETMVKSGNTMGAQKIILGELTKEFGGSAAAAGDTFAGKIDKLKNSFNNMQETIGGAIADAIMPLVGWFQKNQDKIAGLIKIVIDNALPAMAALATAFLLAEGAAIALDIALNANPVALLIDAIVLLAGALVFLQVKFDWIGKTFEYVKKQLEPLYDWFSSNLLPILKEVAKQISGQFKQAWDDFSKAIADIGKVFKDAGVNIDGAKLALYLLAGIIALSVAPLIVFVTAVIGVGLALAKFVAFLAQVVDGIAHFVSDSVKNLGDFYHSVVDTVNQVVAWFQHLPYNLGEALGEMIGMLIKFGIGLLLWAGTAIPDFINGIVKWFQDLPGNIWNATLDASKAILTWFADLKKKAPGEAESLVKSILSFFEHLPMQLYDIGKNLIKGLQNGIKDAWGGFVANTASFMNGFIDGIKKQLGIHSPSTVFAEIGKNIGAGLSNGIDASASAVANATTGLSDAVIGGFQASLATPTVSLSQPTAPAVPTASSSPSTGLSSNFGQDGNSNVSLTLNVGMYAGMPVEKREIALELYRELVRAARSQGVSLPMIGAVGVQ